MLSTFSSGASSLAALINLNHPGHYLHWGFIQLSLANFIVIVLMIVVFFAAILIPFSHRDRDAR
jgi:hypothetical protein